MYHEIRSLTSSLSLLLGVQLTIHQGLIFCKVSLDRVRFLAHATMIVTSLRIGRLMVAFVRLFIEQQVWFAQQVVAFGELVSNAYELRFFARLLVRMCVCGRQLFCIVSMSRATV